jgi:hypothetical protein
LQCLAFIDALTPLPVVSRTRREQDAAAALLGRFADQYLTLADTALFRLVHCLWDMPGEFSIDESDTR